MQAAVIPGPSMRILPASAENNKRSAGLPSYHQSFRSRRPLSPYFLHGRLLRCLILSRLFARCPSPLRPRLRNARAAPRSLLPRQMVLLGLPVHARCLPPRLRRAASPPLRRSQLLETSDSLTASENASRLNISSEFGPKAPSHTCARVRPRAMRSPLSFPLRR